MKRRAATGRGFTLIEMLVVIAIILILAGLLMTAVSAAMKKARETRASAEARQIALAWENYLSEYGTWPVGMGGTEGGAFAPANPAEATNMLGGADVPATANPKKIVFFDRKDKPLTDPWQQNYRYVLDLDYDGKISRPAAQGGDVQRRVIVWSAGVNMRDATAGERLDDRCSWK